MYSINQLKKESNLPGKRANLELLYKFSGDNSFDLIDDCLSYIRNETYNSPDEFLGMCGILGFAVSNKLDINKVFNVLEKHVDHRSWRIREAVAMAIQEIILSDVDQVITYLKKWTHMSNVIKLRQNRILS